MDGNFKIFDCISGRLGRLKRLVSNIYRKHLSETGITESQMMILLSLLELKSIEQIELAKSFALEKSSLSRNLVRLEKMGYIVKSDNYHPTISLTKEGVQYSKKLHKIWERAMKEVANKIGKEGLQALAELEGRI